MNAALYGEVWIFLLLWLGAWEFIGAGVDALIERAGWSMHERRIKLIFYGMLVVIATVLIFTVATELGLRTHGGGVDEPLLFQG